MANNYNAVLQGQNIVGHKKTQYVIGVIVAYPKANYSDLHCSIIADFKIRGLTLNISKSKVDL